MTKSRHPVDMLCSVKSQLYVAQAIIASAAAAMDNVPRFDDADRLVSLHTALADRIEAAIAECDASIARLPLHREAA